MTNLTRWNPLRQISRFDPVTDIEELFRGIGIRPMLKDLEHAMEMRMDVNEDDKTYRVMVDLPGVKKEDIEISIDGNQVSISAEVKRGENEKKEGKEIHSERYQGKAYRAFSLPHAVDSAKSEAKYENGILTLTLPKKTANSAKRLTVKG